LQRLLRLVSLSAAVLAALVAAPSAGAAEVNLKIGDYSEAVKLTPGTEGRVVPSSTKSTFVVVNLRVKQTGTLGPVSAVCNVETGTPGTYRIASSTTVKPSSKEQEEVLSGDFLVPANRGIYCIESGEGVSVWWSYATATSESLEGPAGPEGKEGKEGPIGKEGAAGPSGKVELSGESASELEEAATSGLHGGLLAAGAVAAVFVFSLAFKVLRP